MNERQNTERHAISQSLRFHQYVGVYEYRLAAWLLANPFQQMRLFVSDDQPETWHTLAEYMAPHLSDHPSGKTLAWVLNFSKCGRPMQPDDIRGMPNFEGADGIGSSRSILAHKWAVEFQESFRMEGEGVGTDFRTLRNICANLLDALLCMDITPPRWPNLARLGEGLVQLENEENSNG